MHKKRFDFKLSNVLRGIDKGKIIFDNYYAPKFVQYIINHIKNKKQDHSYAKH